MDKRNGQKAVRLIWAAEQDAFARCAGFQPIRQLRPSTHGIPFRRKGTCRGLLVSEPWFSVTLAEQGRHQARPRLSHRGGGTLSSERVAADRNQAETSRCDRKALVVPVA